MRTRNQVEKPHRWTEEEELRLIVMYDKGKPLSDIAERFGFDRERGSSLVGAKIANLRKKGRINGRRFEPAGSHETPPAAPIASHE